MLLINMLALLGYSVLERQARQGGLQLTTRRIIEKLESPDIVATYCLDGSCLIKLVPVDGEQAMLLSVLAQMLAELRLPRWSHPGLISEDGRLLWLPPPDREKNVG